MSSNKIFAAKSQLFPLQAIHECLPLKVFGIKIEKNIKNAKHHNPTSVSRKVETSAQPTEKALGKGNLKTLERSNKVLFE